jgi:hypothetical protein
MFFFLNLGNNIELNILINNYPTILIGLGILILVKTLGAIVGAWFFMKKKDILILSLISLNVSEASFLIIQQIYEKNMINIIEKEVLIVILLTSISLSPVFLMIASKINRATGERREKYRGFDILIVGINTYSHEIANILDRENISYMIFDVVLDKVINMKSLGIRAMLANFFLHFTKMHIDESKVLIFVCDISEKAEQIIEIKELFPNLEIIALTRDQRTFNLLSKHKIQCLETPSKEFIGQIITQATSVFMNERPDIQ